jgi:hypothetical protein
MSRFFQIKFEGDTNQADREMVRVTETREKILKLLEKTSITGAIKDGGK